MIIWARRDQRWRLWATLRTNRTGTANDVHEFLTRAFALLATGPRTSLVLADVGYLESAFLLYGEDLRSFSIILMRSLSKRMTYGQSSAVARSRRPCCQSGVDSGAGQCVCQPLVEWSLAGEWRLIKSHASSDYVLRHQCSLCR